MINRWRTGHKTVESEEEMSFYKRAHAHLVNTDGAHTTDVMVRHLMDFVEREMAWREALLFCECEAHGIPEGYICGKPACPRTVEANKNLKKLCETIWGSQQ